MCVCIKSTFFFLYTKVFILRILLIVKFFPTSEIYFLTTYFQKCIALIKSYISNFRLNTQFEVIKVKCYDDDQNLLILKWEVC